MWESATECTTIKHPFLYTDPHAMKLPLKAIPQEHSCVFSQVADVLSILGGKQLFFQALLESAITACTKLQCDGRQNVYARAKEAGMLCGLVYSSDANFKVDSSIFGRVH